MCDALIHISKGDKKEIRKRAEEEKVSGISEYTLPLLSSMQAKLKRLCDSTLDIEHDHPKDMPCAIIPAQFLRDWKRWLVHPTENLRPEEVNNAPFMCEHDMLAFDPNYPEDIDSTLCVIDQGEWDTLETM